MKKYCLLIGCTLLLVGCSQQIAIEPLPTELVLQNVQRTSRNLESVRYASDVTFTLQDPAMFTLKGSAKVDGRMQTGGSQLYTHIDAQATIDTVPVELQMEFITAPKNETYVKMLSLDMGAVRQAFSSPLFSDLSGQWLKIIPGDNETDIDVTPDPAFIQAQSEVVRVIEDKGIVALHGKPVYEFDVELDPSKAEKVFALSSSGTVHPTLLQSFLLDGIPTGTLWIDAYTFDLKKVRWNVDTFLDEQDRAVSFEFTITFHNHNEAEKIVLPEEYVEVPSLLEAPAETYVQPEQDDVILEADEPDTDIEEFTLEENHEMIDDSDDQKTESGSLQPSL